MSLPIKKRKPERKVRKKEVEYISGRSPPEIKRRFLAEANTVWKNFSDFQDEVDITINIGKRKHIMSLSYREDAKPRAISDILIQIPKKMTLNISERALKLSEKAFSDYLRHETIHIGYPKHDRKFRDLAKEHGIPMTESQFQGAGYQVQKKIGSRYKTVSVEETLDDAMFEAKKLFDEGEKVRVQY